MACVVPNQDPKPTRGGGAACSCKAPSSNLMTSPLSSIPIFLTKLGLQVSKGDSVHRPPAATGVCSALQTMYSSLKNECLGPCIIIFDHLFSAHAGTDLTSCCKLLAHFFFYPYFLPHFYFLHFSASKYHQIYISHFFSLQISPPSEEHVIA